MEQRTGGKQGRAEAGEGWTEPAGTLTLDLPAPGTVRSELFQSPSWGHFGYSGPDRLRRGHGDGPVGDGGGHAQGTDRTPSQRRLPGFRDEQQEGDDVTEGRTGLLVEVATAAGSVWGVGSPDCLGGALGCTRSLRARH